MIRSVKAAKSTQATMVRSTVHHHTSPHIKARIETRIVSINRRVAKTTRARRATSIKAQAARRISIPAAVAQSTKVRTKIATRKSHRVIKIAVISTKVPAAAQSIKAKIRSVIVIEIERSIKAHLHRQRTKAQVNHLRPTQLTQNSILFNTSCKLKRSL